MKRRKCSVQIVVTVVSMLAVFLVTAGFRYSEAKARMDSVVGTTNYVTVEKRDSELLDTGRIIEDYGVYPEVSADEEHLPVRAGEIDAAPEEVVIYMEYSK